MLTLLRHTAIAGHWKGRCYGASDVGLSTAGRAEARALAGHFAPADVTSIYASPLRRARILGGRIARRLGIPLRLDHALAERSFGTWEGESWDAIHAAVGKAMLGILDAPDDYRPGGGETSSELERRVHRWFDALPRDGHVLAITHGGPIAALVGGILELPVRDWLAHVPPPGHGVRIHRDLSIEAWRIPERMEA